MIFAFSLLFHVGAPTLVATAVRLVCVCVYIYIIKNFIKIKHTTESRIYGQYSIYSSIALFAVRGIAIDFPLYNCIG